MVKFALQVVKSSHPSVICSFENQRYIFNVPDGFQRHYREHKVKITNTPYFFITELKNEKIAGLFGFMQTLVAERNALGSQIFGPQGIVELFNVLRYNDIGGYKTLPFSISDFGNQILLGIKDFKIIDEMLLTTQNDCQLQEALEKIKEMKIDPNNSNNALKNLKNKSFDDGNLVITPIKIDNSFQYLIKTKPIPGGINKFLLKEFNIPQQRMAEFVKNGKITIDDKEILISEVKQEETGPQLSIILDISTEQQLQQLLNNEIFKQNQSQIQCMVHLSLSISEIFYTDFIRSHQQSDHILCNHSNTEAFQPISTQMANELNTYYPKNFPKIQNIELPIPTDLIGKALGYQPLYEYNILPLKNKGFKQIQVQNELRDTIFKYPIKVEEKEIQQLEQSQEHRKLIFLGTASMKPGKYRNVSGIIISNPVNDSYIIMDCGEGTMTQIKDQGLDITQSKVLIYVSHAHSDHHMGLLQILSELKGEVYLIVPACVIPWLTYYQTVMGKFKVNVILSQSLQGEANHLIEQQFHQQRIRYGPALPIEYDIDFEANLKQLPLPAFDLKSINVCDVDHCPQAFGLRLEFQDGKTITYSGDTRPCKQFIELSRNANILIHEATFTDDLQKNAETNKHSTIGEAIAVGNESNSETIVLTHFSQRYSKGVEVVTQDNVVYAFDHMGAHIDQYKQLSSISKIISLALQDES